MNNILKSAFVLFVSCLLLGSCYQNDIQSETDAPAVTVVSDVRPAASPTPPIPQSDGLKLRRESIVYSAVLETVFVYSNDPKYSEIRESGIIGFRKTSVKPTVFEKFTQENSFNLSEEVLEDFKNANRKQSTLRDRYDV